VVSGKRGSAQKMRFLEYIHLKSHLIVVLLCHGGASAVAALRRDKYAPVFFDILQRGEKKGFRLR
jgi:hypothetical protein